MISLSHRHLLYELITKFFGLLGRKLYSFTKELKLSPISVFLYSPINTLYIISKNSGISHAKTKSCAEYLVTYGMPDEFSCKLTQADLFTNIWYKHNPLIDFPLPHGKLFSFGGLQQTYDFFNIDDDDIVATANKTREVIE